MYVCVAGNGEMLVFFPFFPTIVWMDNYLSEYRTYIIGIESYGVISWSQGAPIALFLKSRQCTVFAFLHIFQNFPCTLGGKKGKMLVFQGCVYV